MKIRMILASASPRRLNILRQVGITPEVMPSCADESGAVGTPEQIVMELSRRKAEYAAAVMNQEPEFEAAEAGRKASMEDGLVILGADTVVAADGQILGKPKSAEDAARMIGLIQGRIHHVYTGVTLIFPATGETLTFAEATEVEVYPMTEAQIRRYIATGEPMDKAGAYGIQGYFAAYVKGIRGDYNNVVGLPAARICRELAKRGLY